jgi:hypothetical protein
MAQPVVLGGVLFTMPGLGREPAQKIVFAHSQGSSESDDWKPLGMDDLVSLCPGNSQDALDLLHSQNRWEIAEIFDWRCYGVGFRMGHKRTDTVPGQAVERFGVKLRWGWSGR